jgi:hypothetical protein
MQSHGTRIHSKVRKRCKKNLKKVKFFSLTNNMTGDSRTQKRKNEIIWQKSGSRRGIQKLVGKQKKSWVRI